MIDRVFSWLSRAASNWRLRSDGTPDLSSEQLAEIAATAARRDQALANPALVPLDRLIQWWGKDAQASASQDDLDSLEARYSIRLPDDFRAYLMATMPKGNDWDPEGTNWWPLADIKSVHDECVDWDDESALDSAKLLVFADFMIWCYAWAIDCSETDNRGRVAIITGQDHYVADNFNDFLDRYVRDDGSIHR